MRIEDKLYFSPGVTFSQLDLSGEKLAGQVKNRIDYFFLKPVGLLLEKKYSFAAGVILVSCIDYLAKICYPSTTGVGERIKKWCKEQLPSFNPDSSQLFYEHFRNGLVHEAMIKNGGEFNLKTGVTVKKNRKSLSINPSLLHREIEKAFTDYLERITTDKSTRQELVESIKRDFKYELNI
jgi:hypothetical protein